MGIVCPCQMEAILVEHMWSEVATDKAKGDAVGNDRRLGSENILSTILTDPFTQTNKTGD